MNVIRDIIGYLFFFCLVAAVLSAYRSIRDLRRGPMFWAIGWILGFLGVSYLLSTFGRMILL